MPSSNDSGTHASLLMQLAADATDEAAWGRFVARYSPKIRGWARARGLQDADAEDVAAMVLQRLVDRMKVFVYDPGRSFRGWLRTLTEHAWAEMVSGRGFRDGLPLSAVGEVAARDDLVDRLAAEFDLELLEEAQRRVRLRVAPTTWEAYRLTAVEGLSGAEAANRLGMKVTNVFVAKSSVLARLRSEIQALERVADGATMTR
ncbi:RNA polymerase sigma factor [Aquisphaera insulae]|uniref:RNA polymerase sigma factor n=1 Tax=Aquisphaera insulae TaxID=2712864 RepID=UPI0013EB919A|nr:sigma-70 family RNA polymerase sigma factor [Aquisphaera insulae]